MKTKLIATLMLAAGSMFAGPRVFFGVSVGVPAPVVVAPAPVVAPVAYATPSPGPGYAWVDGYYTYVGARPIWHAGYWRAPVIINRGFVEHRDFDRDHRGFDRDHRDFDRGFRR